ncbi:MAG: hypothetical protein HEEMFOPI_01556 [Holosporales bacterium]
MGKISKKQTPNHSEDYGLVFFDSIDEKYETLKIKHTVKNLSGKSINVTGYPGDSSELRAHKLWPSHLVTLLNRMAYSVRKDMYATFNKMGYLQGDKYAGCFMYTSPGKVIDEKNGLVYYDANTFSGQSGGNGFSELLIQTDEGLTKKTTLDFIHTLGGSVDAGNKGLKIDGKKLKQF